MGYGSPAGVESRVLTWHTDCIDSIVTVLEALRLCFCAYFHLPTCLCCGFSMVFHPFLSLDLKELSGSCRACEMEMVIRFEQVACWHLANSARPAEGKDDEAECIPKL